MKINADPRATPPRPEQPLPPAQPPDEPYYRRGEQARRWGGVLVLIGLVWLVFAIGSRAPLFGVGLVERSASTGSFLAGAQRVVVVGGPDNVAIVGGDEEGVRVEAVKYGFGLSAGAADEALSQLEVDFTQQGDTLLVEVRRPLGAVLGRAPYADLRIALPPGAAAEARLVSGDIEVSDVAGDLALTTVSGGLATDDTRGSMTLSTTSGDLEVRDHSGPVSAESVSGDVRLEGDLTSPAVKTVSGEARVDGAGGRAELTSISGGLSVAGAGLEALTVESTSGDIEARVGLAGGSTSRISNISGDVRVRLEEPVDLRLEATTSSGEIDSEFDGLDEERRSLRGTLGDGGAELTISTTSGDIEVRGD